MFTGFNWDASFCYHNSVLGLKDKGLFALLAWKLGGSVGLFFFNLDVEEMQYKSI